MSGIIRRLIRIFALLLTGISFSCSGYAQTLKINKLTSNSNAVGSPRVCLFFNDDLSALTPVDLKTMVTLEGPLADNSNYPWIKSGKDSVCISNLVPGTDYSVTFKKGFSGRYSDPLDEDLVYKFSSPSYSPAVAAYPVRVLKDKGIVRIPITSVNIKSVRVNLIDIPQSNLRGIAFDDDEGPALGSEKAAKILARGYSLISEHDVLMLPGHDIYTRSSVSLPLESQKGHSYMVLLTDPALSSDEALKLVARGSVYPIRAASLHINSDISAIAERSGQVIRITASHKDTATPVKDANVVMYDKNGVQLDTAVLNSDGETSFQHLSRFGKKLEDAVISVSDENGETCVRVPAYNGDNFSSQNGGAFKFKVKTNGRYYNPGDTITYLAVKRHSDSTQTEPNQLLLDEINPNGLVFKTFKINKSIYGSYSASIKIPKFKGVSGNWNLVLRTASGEILNEREITIGQDPDDSFTISYYGISRILFSGDHENLTFRALYPDGQSAYGLSATASVTYLNDRNPFEAYPEYAVGPEIFEKDWNDTKTLRPTSTDDNGVASFLLTVAQHTYPRRAVVKTIFRDQEGKEEQFERQWHVAPSDNICGIKLTEREDSRYADTMIFNPHGRPVSGRIYYRISQLKPAPLYTNSSGSWKYKFEQVKIRISSGNIDFNSSHPQSGRIVLPKDSGAYLIELLTASGIRTSLKFVNDYSALTPKSQELKLKVKEIGKGNFALIFKSAYEGRAVLAASNSYNLNTRSFEVKKGLNSLRFNFETRLDEPLKVSLTVFFKQNAMLVNTAKGETTLKNFSNVTDFSPVIDTSERRTSDGDSLTVHLSPGIKGSQCSYLLRVISTPFSVSDSFPDFVSDKLLVRKLSKTIYSGIIHSPADVEMAKIDIPLGMNDQHIEIKAFAFNEYLSGYAEKSLDIKFPAQLKVSDFSFLNKGDVAAPEVKIINGRSSARFNVKAECSGAAVCSLERSCEIVSGDSYSFVLPITTNSTGRAVLKIHLEGGGLIRDYRREFDVIPPWAPELYTELIPLKALEKQIYAPDINFSQVSQKAISCGTVPYTNRKVFTNVLLSSYNAELSEYLITTLGMVEANRYLITGTEANLDSVSAMIQSRVDSVAVRVMDDGKLKADASAPKYSDFYTVEGAILLHRAREQGYSVSSEIISALDKHCESLYFSVTDSAMRSALLYHKVLFDKSYDKGSARALANELINAPDMTSPMALCMLASVYHYCDDDDNASLAILLSLSRLNRILSMLDTFRNDDSATDFKKLYYLMDCDTLPVATPALHAASVLYAIEDTKQYGFLDQVLSILRTDEFSSGLRIPVTSALLAMSKFENDKTTLTEFPDQWDKVMLENRSQKPVFCTAAAYGYNMNKILEPENSDLKINVSVQKQDSLTPFSQSHSVRLEDDFVLAVDITSKKQSSSVFKIVIPQIPGMRFERVLKGLDPHFMKLGPLSRVISYAHSERSMTIIAYCRSGVTSRIAILVRPTMRGHFELPSIEVGEQHEVLKPIHWADSGTLRVE